MKLNNISKAFFINLDRRVDRLEHIRGTLSFECERFSAVDATKLKADGEVRDIFRDNLRTLTKAEIACCLSHYKLWKKLTSDESSDSYLILEDDAVFTEKFEDYWNHVFCKNIPDDYSLIYLGGCQPWNRPKYLEVLDHHNKYFCNVKKNDYFSKGDHYWHMTTSSYIISKNAAKLFCKSIEERGMTSAVDHFMVNFFKDNLPNRDSRSVFHLRPLMARQLHEENNNTEVDSNSDIRNNQEKFKEQEITKIIHQSWKDTNVPNHIYKKDWVDSWREKNPEWKYILWTDQANRNLIKCHYPKYLEMYDSYENPIDKADIARFFYMHRYGGIYVDLDFKCLKPLDDLFTGEVMVLGKQEMKERDHIINKNVIPNAFKYSSPGEDFWIDCVDLLPEYKYFENGNPTPPEIATGPIFLFECLDRLKPKNMKILDPEIFYPISWDTNGSAANNSINKKWLKDPESCFPEAYAVTYWTCSWRDQSCVHKNNTIKQGEFINIKDQWSKLKDFDFLNFVNNNIGCRENDDASFSCYNYGKKIAIVSLYTSEIKDYAVESEHNIKEYCIEQGYTFYVYRERLDKESHPNWSKSRALLNHINDHDFVIWMDSDTLVFDSSKKFEAIIEEAGPEKCVVACEDIGSNNKSLPRGSLFNSGVVIFKNDPRVGEILQEWWDFRKKGDTSSLYSSGGDQEILVDIVSRNCKDSNLLKIFPMNKFNTDPRMIDQETFVLHFMSYPAVLKGVFMKYWNS
jgi:mannosyltransferase OCH1-like enzyme